MPTRVIDTPIGPVALTAGPDGLVRVELGPDPSVVDPGGGTSAEGHLARGVAEVVEYLDGRRRSFDVALDRSPRHGFRGAVLDALETVPYGETVSYGELAEMAGRPRAARAVGTAMATNPLPLLVPCHRVVLAGGRLGAYGPGPERKEWLLRMEGAWPVP